MLAYCFIIQLNYGGTSRDISSSVDLIGLLNLKNKLSFYGSLMLTYILLLFGACRPNMLG